MTLADNVGRALQQLRRDAGISLSELSRRSGVGKATLSELEAGRRNPTLETLYALTTALRVPLSAVLPEAGADTISGRAVDAVLISRIVTGSGSGTTEVYRVVIRPGAVQRSEAHTAGTTEHLVVISGTAVVGPEGRPRTVRAGRSHGWVADTPHTYAAQGSEPVDAILVMCYPATAGG